MLSAFSRFLSSRHLPLALFLLSILLTLPSLWVGLQFDDYLLEHTIRAAPNLPTALEQTFIFMDGDTFHARKNMETGAYPWWTLPDGKSAFWRPLSALTHWADFQLWQNSPALMHAQNIIWFALGVYLVALLYREVLPAPAAGLAALLFAIDDAHGYAVGWISNRNALMAFVFAALALLLRHWWMTRRNHLYGAASMLCFALSLLSAEAGIATLAFLFSYSLFMDDDLPASLRARMAKQSPIFNWIRFLPYVPIFFAWSWLYRLGGYGGWGTSYVDPMREPMAYLYAFIERAPVLWLGALAYPPAEAYPFVANIWIKGLWVGAGIALTVYLGIRIFPLALKDKTIRFWLMGAGLATLPVCASLPANRLLFFIGLGIMPALAMWLLHGDNKLPKRIMAIIHLGLAIILLPFTAYSPKTFGNIEDAALSAPIKQTVIIVSAPSAFHADYFRLIRERYGVTVPERVWYLGAGLSPLSVYRQDERTLTIIARDGYISGFDAVFRGGTHPLSRGEKINLSGIQITVEEMTRDGRPSTVTFEFSESLESLNYQWLIWRKDGYVEWQAPNIGGSVSIP